MVVSKMDDGDPNIWDDDCESFPDHVELKERLRKTLYYGKPPRMDRPSLPMTELAVEYFQEAVPRELGRVDMYWASSLSRKASISPCAMMLGMVYIERLRNKDPEYLEKISSEELFLVAMMLASKYLYDEGVTEEVYNDEWADSANLDLTDINLLERDFLSAMNWNLFVSKEEFESALGEVETQIALRQGKANGSLTYSDLVVLLHCEPLHAHNWHLLKEICKVFAVCSLAYTAGTLTMVASPMTLDLVKAELHTVRPPTFDLTPISVLMEQFSQWVGPTVSMTQLPRPCLPTDSPCVQLADSISDIPRTEPKPACIQRKKHSSTFLSQFLTLTLFKDTLITFVVGMKDCDVNETIPRVPCHCPVCPLHNTPRRNKTIHETAIPTNRETKPIKPLCNCKQQVLSRSQEMEASDVYEGGTDDGAEHPRSPASRCFRDQILGPPNSIQSYSSGSLLI